MIDLSSPIFLLTVVVSVIVAYIVYKFSGSGSDSKKVAQTVDAATKVAREKPVGPFTKEEVSKHSTDTDCWLIIDGKVYDVTDYILDHPGGDSILKNAGGDASEGAHGPQHPPSMWDVLALYYIGDLVSSQ